MGSGNWPRRWRLLLVAVLASAQSRAEPPPTFPSRVELVRLDVVVVDREGRPVEGLTAADFQVEENGRPRKVESFEPIVVRVRTPAPPSGGARPTLVAEPQTHVAEEGRCVLIFVDDVHLASSTAQQLRLQLVPFVEREVRDGDWVMLVAPQAHVRWTARTAWERAQIPRIPRAHRRPVLPGPFPEPRLGVRGHGGGRAATPGAARRFSRRRRPHRRPEPPLRGGLRRRATAYRDDVTGASRGGRIPCRRARAQVPDPLFAGIRPRPRFPEFDEIVDLARRANVAVHFVDPRGLASTCAESGADPRDCDNSLTGWMKSSAGAISIAQATGGRDSRLNDPVAEVRRVLEESQAYYLIGYERVDRAARRAPRPGARSEGRAQGPRAKALRGHQAERLEDARGAGSGHAALDLRRDRPSDAGRRPGACRRAWFELRCDLVRDSRVEADLRGPGR